jgi:hypothetical protein
VLEGVQDKFGGHVGGRPPTHDHSGEDVEDEGDINDARPGRDVGEVGHPQLVRGRGSEVTIDQIRRSSILRIADRGSDTLASQRALPAVLCHQPLDRAPGDVVALAAQTQPHLAGTESGHEPLLASGPDKFDDLGIAQRPLRRRSITGLVVGGRGDLEPVLGQHAADRLDPELLTMSVDELH